MPTIYARVDGQLTAALKEVAALAKLPTSNVVEALLSARLDIPHVHEAAAATAVARWKAGLTK